MLPTSPCGRRPSPGRCAGPRRGAAAVPAGTLSAPLLPGMCAGLLMGGALGPRGGKATSPASVSPPALLICARVWDQRLSSLWSLMAQPRAAGWWLRWAAQGSGEVCVQTAVPGLELSLIELPVCFHLLERQSETHSHSERLFASAGFLLQCLQRRGLGRSLGWVSHEGGRPEAGPPLLPQRGAGNSSWDGHPTLWLHAPAVVPDFEIPR